MTARPCNEVEEVRRLNDEGRHDLALDRLAPLVFAAVADDPPSLAEPVRELLEECCFDYLIAISNRFGLTPDLKRPTERWVRAIHHKLPRERRADEYPRLAVLAVMHLFNMLAHEAELAEEFPASRAAAGVFAVARLALAERYHEVLALERHAGAWIGAVRGKDPDIVALSRLRLLRDRLTACDVLRRDRAADGTLRAALAFRDSHPAAWKMIAVELLSGHARHLARIGRGADALEWIDRAIVDAHDEDDRASAQAVRMDLRREILGETSDFGPIMEKIASGGAQALAEVRRLGARLDSGAAIGPSEMTDIGERLATLFDDFAQHPVLVEATLSTRVQLALATGNRSLAFALRSDVVERVDLPGRAGVEASALALALDILLGAEPPRPPTRSPRAPIPPCRRPRGPWRTASRAAPCSTGWPRPFGAATGRDARRPAKPFSPACIRARGAGRRRREPTTAGSRRSSISKRGPSRPTRRPRSR